MRMIAPTILSTLMVAFAPLTPCMAETHQNPVQSPDDAGDDEESSEPPLVCPDLPDGLMNIICDAVGSAKPPGGHPWTIRYCCAHSARDFHDACERAKQSCYTMWIMPPPTEPPTGHAINLIEEPKGTCRFVDTTSGDIRVGGITFPCNNPPERAICRAMDLPDNCGWRVKRISPSPIPGWGPDTCAKRDQGQEINSVNECAQCCSFNAATFNEKANFAEPSNSRDPDETERTKELWEMTFQWQMECYNACESHWSTPIEKNPGARFAIDLCQIPGVRARYTCPECCEVAANAGQYPKNDKEACLSACESIVVQPAKPKKPLLPRLKPRPKKPRPSPKRPKLPIRRK